MKRILGIGGLSRRLVVGVVVVIAACVWAGSAAAGAPRYDRVVGYGQRSGLGSAYTPRFWIHARSGPSGENAQGTVWIDWGTSWVDAPHFGAPYSTLVRVTNLCVTGDTATIVGLITGGENATIGDPLVVEVQGGSAGSAASMGGIYSGWSYFGGRTLAEVCQNPVPPENPSIGFLPLVYGDIHVTDADSAQFVTVDYPGAVSSSVNDINNAGTVVGTWSPTSNLLSPTYGFTEQLGGQPTTFGAPGLVGSTLPSGINDEGTSVGYNGWIRSLDGNFTQLDDPAAVGATNLSNINDCGVIVGFYADASNFYHGFVYYHGTFTPLDYPGASGTLPFFSGTVPTAVNNSGAIVGYYTDASGVTHGFLYRRGTFTTIPDAPGAGTAPYQGTIPVGISSSGEIVGIANYSGNGSFGWVLSKGQFSFLIDPSARPGGSFPQGLSSNGRLVAGAYYDASGVEHGYVATLTPRRGDW